MKVLIWKAYGEIDLYNLSAEGVKNIKQTVQSILDSWCLETHEYDELRNCHSIGELVDFVNEYCSDADDFEIFEVKEIN